MSFEDEYCRCSIAERVARDPCDVSIIQDGREVTNVDFDRMVRSIAAGLRQRGIGSGDRVAFQLPNRIETLALFWACFRIQAVACPISTRLPAAAVAEVADSIAAKVVIGPDDLEFNGEFSCEAERIQPIRAATIIFSSGSTGTPKAIVHNLQSHFSSAIGSNKNIPLRRGDRWLLSLPVYHVGGLAIMFRCVLAGATLVIDSRFSEMSDQIMSNRVTHVSIVATQLKRIMAANHSELATLRSVLLGGSALPRTLIQEALEANIPLRTTYGLSEMASQVTTTLSGTVGECRFSSGRLVGEAELTINYNGEILVRGPTLMLGYLTDGEINPTVDSQGWFHTKDRGSMDVDGYLTVLGRMDNMFISGGENVYPEEIECALLSISGIRQAIVVAVTCSEFGQRPVAFIDSDEINIAQIVQHLKSRLAKYKIPDRFLLWPINENGTADLKPSRRRLAAIANSL